jgi:hypothetical protein
MQVDYSGSGSPFHGALVSGRLQLACQGRVRSLELVRVRVALPGDDLDLRWMARMGVGPGRTGPGRTPHANAHNTLSKFSRKGARIYEGFAYAYCN